jgi:acyl dehydratase
MFFEDFAVGQRFVSPERKVTQSDLDGFLEISRDRNSIHVEGGPHGPILHGPYGLTVFLGLLHEMRLVEASAVAMLDANWKFLVPIYVGDVVHFEMTITRCRRTAAMSKGVINRHVRLVNQDGLVVQEGTTALLVLTRDTAEPGPEQIARDFATLEWAKTLRQLLLQNDGFVSATASYDGCIGLQAGSVSCQLRIYRANLIDVAAATPLGSSFLIVGDEIAWVDLVLAGRNDFMERAMRNEFKVTGNQYEYLRLTKAVVELFNCVRDLAATARCL